MAKSFDPIEFYRLAEQLARQSNSQVKLRTAVGRTYYAMFLLARTKTNVRTKRDAHEAVIAALENRDEHRIATELGQLRRLREAADYQLTPDIRPFDNWKNNWSWAKSIVEDIHPKLEAMPTTPLSRPPKTRPHRR